MINNGFLNIGTIVKCHGISGDIVIDIISTALIENIEELVFIEIDGLPVPFFIERFKQNSPQRVQVKLLWVDNSLKAKQYVNCKVFLPANTVYLKPDEALNSPDIIIGFAVYDNKYGLLGTVSKVLYQNNNPVMVVNNHKTEILIPLHSDFIIKFNVNKKQLSIKTPPGLIELYQ